MRERGTTVGSTTTEGGGPTVVGGGSTAGDVVEVEAGAVVDVVVEVVVLDATGTLVAEGFHAYLISGRPQPRPRPATP